MAQFAYLCIAFCLCLSVFVSHPVVAADRVVLQLKWTHAFQFAGYYAAKAKGFYRDAGLEVEIRQAKPGLDVPGTVLTGEAQYGVGTSSLLLERQAGKPLVVLAAIFQHSPLVLIAREQESAQAVHDLIGKRVMIEPQSDELIAYLKQVSVPIEQLQLLQHSFNPQDLIEGRVDAISAYVTNERYYLDKIQFPYHLYTPRSAGIDFYGDNLFTSEQEISNHPQRVKAFRAASLKGWRYAMNNQQEIAELIHKQYSDHHPLDFYLYEAQQMETLLQPLLVDPGYMSLGRWQHIKDTYVELEMMDADFPLEDFLYNADTQVDMRLVYGSAIAALLVVLIAATIVFYIMRTNRRLDLALAQSRAAQQQIWNQANLDPLTNLPNRRMYRDCMTELMQRAEEHGSKLALLYLDLDRFKEVNDVHGHKMGDLLLVDVAKRLQSCVREQDSIARLGGDEFIILMPDVEGSAAVEQVAQQVLSSLAEPYMLQREMVYISASIGITRYPDDASEMDTLLQHADQAMYAAKATGRNCFHYFTESIQKDALQRVQLVNDLRLAVEQQQFELYYQPIVEMDSGRICKAEALIRWHHPKRGLVGPLEFISVAEETGDILAIGDWVFKQATEQAKQWCHYDLQISVNTSPLQYMQSEHSMQHWVNHLQDLGLPGRSVVAEITENMLMGSQSEVRPALHTFKEQGIQVALDDFGTGYSSLSYLNKFDIDFIKIDQSFVRNLEPGSNELTLCEVIIVMAHKLGHKVIAEGVETEQQQQLLKAIGCDYGQGFLFAKPLPAAAFDSLLAKADGGPQQDAS